MFKELKIDITDKSIREEFERHPYGNTFLGIGDILQNFSVSYAPYQLSFNELLKHELPYPFIAHFKKSFILVTQLSEEKVNLIDENNIVITLTGSEFQEKYQGAIMIVEKKPTSGENNYKYKKTVAYLERLRIPFVMAGATFLILLFLMARDNDINNMHPVSYFLLIIKSFGLIISILLLIQSLDASNPLIRQICGSDENKSCNAILGSPAAKLWGIISWSEIGFLYFGATWLALLFNIDNILVINGLFMFNILCLPYTFYSVYYQGKIARQWCKLCLSVQVVLWLEFFCFLTYPNARPVFELKNVSAFLSAFLASLIVWMFLKPLFVKAERFSATYNEMLRFKFDPGIFSKLLNDQIKFALLPNENTINIGDSNAPNTITMVSNPFCNPCAKTHKILEEWLAKRKDIKLQMVFNVLNSRDRKAAVVSHLLTLKQTEGDEASREALNQWYSQKEKNYDDWVANYPSSKEIDQLSILKMQSDWCRMTDITDTPTLFLNGRRLPQPYKPEDIKYFI